VNPKLSRGRKTASKSENLPVITNSRPKNQAPKGRKGERLREKLKQVNTETLREKSDKKTARNRVPKHAARIARKGRSKIRGKRGSKGSTLIPNTKIWWEGLTGKRGNRDPPAITAKGHNNRGAPGGAARGQNNIT